ncbi:MAG: hypothetical protein GXP10_08920 [Gammaproteobacteria bacterium]|nr:hypothetical protein [Gammaproteobacteria bacterium]
MRRLLAHFSIALVVLCLASGSSHAASKTEKIQVKDLYYGKALYDYYQNHHYDALIQLLAADQQGRLKQNRKDAQLLLAGVYLSYGVHRKATEIFEQLIDENTPLDVRNRVWFQLAKVRRQRGHIESAEQALSRIEGELPAESQNERIFLQATSLIERGQYDETAELLKTIDNGSAWYYYGAYNLALALLRKGNFTEGVLQLEQIGATEVDVNSGEISAIKDQANLTLALTYLQRQQPSSAKQHLEQVQVNDLLSDKALLAMGWAHSVLGQYRQALVYWMELQQRDSQERATQEALLAVPYALAQLRANKQALQHYQSAMVVFNDELQRLSLMIDSIRGGSLPESLLANDTSRSMDGFWQLEEIPDTSTSRYLINLIAQRDFQEGLRNYRELRFLKQELKQRLDDLGIYETLLETQGDSYKRRIPWIKSLFKSHDLKALKKRRDTYAAQLQRIKERDDVFAVAPRAEQKMLATTERLKKQLQRLSKQMKVDNYNERLRMVRGILLWRANADFKARLWQANKALGNVDQAYAENQARRQSLENGLRNRPQAFIRYDTEISSLRQRIEGQLARINTTLQTQEELLNEVAIESLEKRRGYLRDFLLQAKISVAQTYDRAKQEQSAQ